MFFLRVYLFNKCVFPPHNRPCKSNIICVLYLIFWKWWTSQKRAGRCWSIPVWPAASGPRLHQDCFGSPSRLPRTGCSPTCLAGLEKNIFRESSFSFAFSPLSHSRQIGVIVCERTFRTFQKSIFGYCRCYAYGFLSKHITEARLRVCLGCTWGNELVGSQIPLVRLETSIEFDHDTDVFSQLLICLSGEFGGGATYMTAGRGQ